MKDISKIVSEVVPFPDTIIFDGLSAIDLCITKEYIKQTFCSGFDLTVVVVTAVSLVNKRVCQSLICFNLGHKKKYIETYRNMYSFRQVIQNQKL